MRAAIEDNPVLEPLLERQQGWMNAIVEAESFERLCETVRQSLDDFMGQIETRSYDRTNRQAAAAMAFVKQRYTTRITLADVAAAMGLSRFRAGHLVKEATGQSVFQHIKRLRVAEARRLLADTDTAYAELAYDLGFADQSTFIRQFRELTGATPARFRHAARGAKSIAPVDAKRSG